MKRENELYKLWQTGAMTTTKLCKRIAELEAQIEHMKCCGNCGNAIPEINHCKLSKDDNLKCRVGNLKHWKRAGSLQK